MQTSECVQEFPIESKSFDFKILDENVLLEVNPYATHNSTWHPYKPDKSGIDQNYHYEKSKIARDNGYRCINIWDWDNADKILMSLLNKQVVYARNCEIKEISEKDSSYFLNMYHFQNSCKSLIRIGLYYENELVSVMTFGKPRYNKKYEWELLRYCCSCKIIGGAEKMFSYFVKNYNPNSIISYCDLSKFNGDVYTKLGFELKDVSIGKHWYSPKLKKHITDNLLRQRGFDQLLGKEFGTFGKGTSNEFLMREHGFVEIYDSGQATYVINF